MHGIFPRIEAGGSGCWRRDQVVTRFYSQATFVAASPTDLLWLDQIDLLSVLEEFPETREWVSKTATTAQNVRASGAKSMALLALPSRQGAVPEGCKGAVGRGARCKSRFELYHRRAVCSRHKHPAI